MDQLRDRIRGLFPQRVHRELLRFGVALLLPPRLGPVRLFLAAPYIVRVSDRLSGRGR